MDCLLCSPRHLHPVDTDRLLSSNAASTTPAGQREKPAERALYNHTVVASKPPALLRSTQPVARTWLMTIGVAAGGGGEVATGDDPGWPAVADCLGAQGGTRSCRGPRLARVMVLWCLI